MAVPTSDPVTDLLPSLGSRLHKLWLVDVVIAVVMTLFAAQLFTLQPYGRVLGGVTLGVSAVAFGVSYAAARRLDEVNR